jgi:hypothetical protein
LEARTLTGTGPYGEDATHEPASGSSNEKFSPIGTMDEDGDVDDADEDTAIELLLLTVERADDDTSKGFVAELVLLLNLELLGDDIDADEDELSLLLIEFAEPEEEEKLMATELEGNELLGLEVGELVLLDLEEE